MATVVTVIISEIRGLPRSATVTAGRVLLVLPDQALESLSRIAASARSGSPEAELEIGALAVHIWQRENSKYPYYRDFGPLFRLAMPTLLDLVELEVSRRKEGRPEDSMLSETLSERAWWRYMTAGAAERIQEVLEKNESVARH